MNYRIFTIPHQNQKYETVGDYYTMKEAKAFKAHAVGVNPLPAELADGEDVRHIIVSEMENKDYEFLVALHEFVESYLVEKNGVSDEVITEFDKSFEAKRPEGNLDEPGDALDAPYRKEHRIATTLERTAAQLLKVNWIDYEKNVNALYQHGKTN